MFKKENGITLVALVVTIIVLLILAGVSISMIAGENGIATRATGAAKETDTGAAQENLEMVISEAQTDYMYKFAEGEDVEEPSKVSLINAKLIDEGYVLSSWKDDNGDEKLILDNTVLYMYEIPEDATNKVFPTKELDDGTKVEDTDKAQYKVTFNVSEVKDEDDLDEDGDKTEVISATIRSVTVKAK